MKVESSLSGYRRSDGRVGFRNHVLVMPLTGCQMEIARRIAMEASGATAFAHSNGCDLQSGDFDLLGTMLEGAVTHPNVGGVVFLAMGCAATQSLQLPAKARAAGRLVEILNTHRGTSALVSDGAAMARKMAAELARAPREPVPWSALTLGTKCGASDKNSFAYCHPVVGRACDMMVQRGATVVLAEDCELAGCAEQLAARAAAPEIASRIRRMAQEVDAGWQRRFGQSFEQIVLKGSSREDWVKGSLGHAAKAGSTPIRGFFDMGEPLKGPGLVILNTPNSDLESVTALAACGCNVTLFTTGRGTPVGSPLSITLKITATQKTYEQMEENIDLSVAEVIERPAAAEAAAERVVSAVAAAVNGCPAKAETLRHWEVAIPIRGVTY